MQKKLEITYEEFNHWKQLAEKDQDLVLKAQEICEKAYAPYSKFKVGASLRLKNELIVCGNNQENAAYPSGLCAERVALFHANAVDPESVVETICVVAKGDLIPFHKTLSPCGACRQVMMEYENKQQKNMRVILVGQDDRTVVFNRVEDLLPLAFKVGD